MDIKVEVTYKNIKNMHLRVRDGIVKISAPFKIKEEFIKKFVNDNLDYIKNQLKLQEEKQNAKNIKINDFITLFDRKYQILPISTKAKVTENFIFVNEDKDIRNQIKNLFKNEFLKYIITLTYKYFSIMSLQCEFPKIIIKDVKSKWGSYNKIKHEIIYASELMFYDEEVITYIIVHELSHILEFNHSKNFYDVVSKYCPNYKQIKNKLKRG